jgi:hypothetical protein
MILPSLCSAKLPKTGPELVDEELRLFERSEVPAARQIALRIKRRLAPLG